MDAAARIAETVLYEGYLLWPYRRSATKNVRRWTFGGVHPRAHSEAGHPDDPWRMQTECLVEGDDPAVAVRVRFLHVVERRVCRRTPEGLQPVDELTVAGGRHISWDEATEREVAVPELALADLSRSPRSVPIDVPAGRVEEALVDAAGADVGAIVRSWRALGGVLQLRAERLREGLFRLRARIDNTTPWEGSGREDSLRQTFCSTHTLLRAGRGAFVSLTDPPERLRHEAEVCANVGTWPVLVGPEGERHTLLSSPIILADHPEVAPESPGDLFDGTEIDQLLILSILGLSDAEREEMAASDPRARAILERCAGLSPEELMRLHGAVRDVRPVP